MGGGEDKKAIHWIKASKLTDDKLEGGLGMQNFRWLNEAFMVKQAWRLVSQSELLASKIIKGRYYSGGSLWEAKPGYNPSHIWRGIHKAIEMLRKGVGENSRVGGVEWSFDSSGCFSTKSAYKLIKLHRGIEGTSRDEEIKQFWGKVRRGEVPMRVKMMVWRLFNGALPDAINLRRRGCNITMECLECGMVDETTLHSVRDCWKAKAFWMMAKIESNGRHWIEGGVEEWLFVSAREEGKQTFKRIMCGAWLLWNGRNATRHEKKSWTVKEMTYKLESMMFQGEEYSGRKLATKVPNALFLENDKDKICIFCDGAWKDSREAVGMAAVVRNQGRVEAVVYSWCVEGPVGNEVEGEALCMGLRVAEQLKYKEVVIISLSRRSEPSNHGV